MHHWSISAAASPDNLLGLFVQASSQFSRAVEWNFWDVSKHFINFLSFFFLQVKVTVMDKNDSPPTFRDLPSSYMVSEDLGTGQLVATIKASDPDTIGKLEYSLISGDDGKFLLEKYQGTLKLLDTLDRETKDLYKLVIRVTDGVQFTETTIAVQVSHRFLMDFIISTKLMWNNLIKLKNLHALSLWSC